MSTWLPEVAPAPGDIKIESHAQDRFYNTDLDKTLKAKGITTLVLTGWKISGSVTYTSVGATLRGYTVVVPVDAHQRHAVRQPQAAAALLPRRHRDLL
jgi:nicotinamidase-related amidase